MAQNPPPSPDFHFLLFAPGLGETWFFRAARRYWYVFRPIAHSMAAPDDLDLVGYPVEEGRTVAITLVARRDTAAAVRAAISQRFPNVYLDPLVYDTADDLALTLNGRADAGQRFGVPTGETGGPTATPRAPIQPTPGPIIVPPGG